MYVWVCVCGYVSERVRGEQVGREVGVDVKGRWDARSPAAASVTRTVCETSLPGTPRPKVGRYLPRLSADTELVMTTGWLHIFSREGVSLPPAGPARTLMRPVLLSRSQLLPLQSLAACGAPPRPSPGWLAGWLAGWLGRRRRPRRSSIILKLSYSLVPPRWPLILILMRA